MAYAKGELVISNDYNAGVNLTQRILGVGDGDYGYGQSITTLGANSGELITALQWANLYKDLNRIKKQQAGIENAVTPPVKGDTIFYDVKFDNGINEIEDNRFILGGDSTVSQRLESTSSAPWSGTISHEFNIAYGTDSFNRLRYFFNTGSHIKLIPDYEALPGVSSDVGTAEFDVLKLIRSVGEIRFNYTETSSTNVPASGPGGTEIGFYDLTPAFQRIYYATNIGYTSTVISLAIFARTADTGNRVEFRIDVTADDPGPDGDIDAAITSTVGYRISQMIQSSFGAPTITTTQTFP